MPAVGATFDAGGLLYLFGPLKGRNQPLVLSLGITLLALIPDPPSHPLGYEQEPVASDSVFLHIDQLSVPGYSRIVFTQAAVCAQSCLANHPSVLIQDFFPIRTPMFFRRGSLIFESIGTPTLQNGSQPPANAVIVERSTITPAGPAIPEPGTAWLAVAGLGVVVALLCRQTPR